MTEEKYNVHISNTDEGNDYCDTKTLTAGQISESELEKYIQELAKYNAIPETSCLYSFSFDFHTNTEKSLFLRADLPCFNKSKGLHEKYSAGVNINIKLKNCHKCSTNNQFHDIREVCFKNIRTGKCTDAFVCEIIGKKLFANQYTENQR